ncbi:MAG: hypothetical protein ACFFAV_09460, partial [Candidatus Hermodarchaeota archaeon]
TNEFSPNPVTVLDYGRDSLDMVESHEKNGIKIVTRNNLTNSEVTVISNVEPNRIKKVPSEFALRHELIYNFTLNEGGIKVIPLTIL